MSAQFSKAAKTDFSAATPADVNRIYGNQILGALAGGTLLGAGGMGLFHALKRMKKKQEDAIAPPSLADVAQEAPTFLTAPQKQSFDASLLAMPVGGAGVGALIGALRAQKGEKMRGALAGAGIGGAAGIGATALSRSPAGEMVGRALPRSIFGLSGLFGESNLPAPETGAHGAARDLGTLLAGAGGAYAGGKAVDSLLKRDESFKNVDKVQNSRDEYFKELLGEPDEEEKQSVNSRLDDLYALYEKGAKDGYWLWGDGSGGPHETQAIPAAFRNMSQLFQTAAGISLLGGGAFGAKYMYDKTRANSDARVLAAARAAKARARGGEAPWIDPVELASVKELATQKELANAPGR